MALLVLVAHSGRTLQLDVQPSTRVDAVQHALVSFTGIPVADQIAMYQGARLDPAKPLGAYRLPVDPAVASLEDHPVFLYCRSYLKPGAALPPPEALPPHQVQVPPLAEVNMAHPLHSAPSPLVRALPDYERHFQHHLATTRAYWEVAQKRLDRCRQLLSEQEVQARAADAARANVEAHYNYILNSYQTFLDKYNAQHVAHATLLATFPSDLAALEAIELHPSLQQQPSPQQQQQIEPGSLQQQHSLPGAAPALALAPASPAPPAPGPGPRRLSDLYPVQRLREWAETCSRSHASFGAKVSELEALFQLLRKDVEGLFMQAPSVDLDALGRQMSEHEALLDEHSSMVQVLSKDLRTVRTLVEDVVRQLGSTAGGGGGGLAAGGGGLRQGALHDAAAAMEAIHETHRNRVLPRLAQLDSQLAAFGSRVEASKVAMSRDVLAQLQRISGQQSRIRDMKNKLAAFHEVLGRQDAAFAELRVVHRLPSAYRALLAEVVRRTAWHQLYCGQAGRLAEHMVRFRDKEAGRRTAFAAQVARYIPSDLLARAGLAAEPPHCAVTVPSPEVPLIAVAVADLQRLSYLDERLLAASAASLRASAAAASSSSLHHHHQHHHHRASAAGAGSQHPHSHHPHPHPHQHLQHPQAGSRLAGAASMAFPGTVAVLDADPPPPTDSVNALEMENARLRAELANHIAAACIRELTAPSSATAAPAAAASTGAGGAGEGQQPTATEQQQPAAAAAGSASRQPRVSGGGGGAASPSGAAAAGGGAGGSPVPSRRDPAEIAAVMQRAIGMKEDLIRHQQREIAALAARAASYEERITALEALLHQRAMASGGDAAGAGLRSGAESQVDAAAAASAGSASRGQGGAAEERQAGTGAGMVVAEVEAEPATLAVVEQAISRGKEDRQQDEDGEAAGIGGAAAAATDASGEAEEPGGTTGGPEAVAAAVQQREGEAVSRDGQGLQPPRPPRPPVLSVDVDAGAAGSVAVGSVLSPFSLQAALQQPFREPAADAADSKPQPSATPDGGGLGDAPSGPTEESATGAGDQARRGSSGPQAIPLVPGGLRRGGGAGEEPAVPMAVGSLPFAMSLPVGSALTSRLASSPSVGVGGGIGLGLALGFGLAALAEGPLRSGSPSRQGEGSRRLSGSSSSGIDSESSSSGSDGDEEREGSGGARTSGGASSSGGLQFQPSWTAPASGDSVTAAAGGGTAMDAPADGTADRVEDGVAVGFLGLPGEAAGGADGAAAARGDGDAAATEAAARAPVSIAAAAADGHDGDEDDGALAEDVPDIDEVFDSDGAWEVTSAATTAVAAVADAAASSEPQAEAAGDVAGDGSSETDAGGRDGDGGDEAEEEAGGGDGDGDGERQQLEASSGYESVGSVVSDTEA